MNHIINIKPITHLFNVKTMTLLMGLFVSFEAQTFVSNLTTPKEFQVLAVNGKKTNTQQFRKFQNTPLKRGNNKLAIQYNANWQQNKSKAISKIKSNVFIVSFNLRRVENIKLTYLKPANLSASKAFSQNPQFILVSDRKNQLRTKTVPLSNPSLINLINKTKPTLNLKNKQKKIIF